MSPSGGEELRRRMRRLEAQIEEMERSAEPEVCEGLRAMLQTLLDFHGAGLGRMVEMIQQAGEPGRALLETFGNDGLTGSLLLLYGLHPLDLETRIRKALDGLGPVLRMHGQDVEIRGIDGNTLRLRLTRAGDVPLELRAALEEALRDVAPELDSIEIEETARPTPTLISLPLVGAQPGAARP